MMMKLQTSYKFSCLKDSSFFLPFSLAVAKGLYEVRSRYIRTFLKCSLNSSLCFQSEIVINSNVVVDKRKKHVYSSEQKQSLGKVLSFFNCIPALSTTSLNYQQLTNRRTVFFTHSLTYRGHLPLR